MPLEAPRCQTVIPGKNWYETYSVHIVYRGLSTGYLQEGRGKVDSNYRSAIQLTRCDSCGPFYSQWDTNTALVQHSLVASERLIGCSLDSPAIIGIENDQCIIC